MKTLIAIDPGVNGGIAWQLADNPAPAAIAMPRTEGDIMAELAALKEGSNSEIVAFIEQVGGYVGRPQPGSRMFRFGDNFGFIKGALMALKIRMELVRPQQWQKALGLGTSAGLKPNAWKNKLKGKAQQLYPSCKVTLQTADALLLLEYAKRGTN